MNAASSSSPWMNNNNVSADFFSAFRNGAVDAGGSESGRAACRSSSVPGLVVFRSDPAALLPLRRCSGFHDRRRLSLVYDGWLV
jgi:hypothetical protein